MGLCVISALRIDEVGPWPGELELTGANATDPKRFLTKASMDTYMSCTWVASLVALVM